MGHVDAAIARVHLAYDALRQRTPDEKLYVAYSGGKDSECVLRICREAVGEAVIEAHYNATGIDPPELVRHIKRQFSKWTLAGLECHFNKPCANMHDLIVAKGPPTRKVRYCCEKLKEGGGTGRVVVTGVRWAEKESCPGGRRTAPTALKELRQTQSYTGMWSNITDEDIANAEDGSLALPPILPPDESEGSPHNASGEYPGDNSGNSIDKSMCL